MEESEQAFVLAVDGPAHEYAYPARDDVHVGCAIDWCRYEMDWPLPYNGASSDDETGVTPPSARNVVTLMAEDKGLHKGNRRGKFLMDH